MDVRICDHIVNRQERRSGEFLSFAHEMNRAAAMPLNPVHESRVTVEIDHEGRTPFIWVKSAEFALGFNAPSYWS